MNINGFGQGQGQGQPRQADSLDHIKKWWNECPLFTKSMVYICSGVWILCVFGLNDYFSNYAIVTVLGIQLQRLFLSPFYNPGILGILFGFLVFLPMSAKKEREWGTVKTIIDFIYKNLLINLMFCIVCFALAPITASIFYMPNNGLWPIYFYYLVERCLLDPNGVSQLLCFPVQVRNTLYPIILLLLFSLFSQAILWNLAAAIVVGFLHFKYLNNSYHSWLNESKCAAWETSFLFNCLRTLPNYVSASGNMFANRGASQESTGANVGGFSGPARAAPTAFTSFAGKGITLGGSDDAPPQQSNSPPIPRAENGQYGQLNDDSGDLEQR